ncbi:MAG: hypothetical protein N2Z57_06520 [Oscillospiraceae bacterium]|nr:hypothetical protein [Oscillospiraceae bacterium]
MWQRKFRLCVGLDEGLKQWLVAGKTYYGDNSLGRNSGIVNNASGSTISVRAEVQKQILKLKA